MANLTITVDKELLKRARLRALEEGTSVNALLRGHLERYAAHEDTLRQAVGRLLARSRRCRSGRGRRTWTRDELHER